MLFCLGTEIKFTKRTLVLNTALLYISKKLCFYEQKAENIQGNYRQTLEKKIGREMFVFCVFVLEKFCSFSSATGP